MPSHDVVVAEEPKPALLFCPHCYKQHIDEPPWDAKPHTTHLCKFCNGEFDVSHPRCYGVNRPHSGSFYPSNNDLVDTIAKLKNEIAKEEKAENTERVRALKVQLDWWVQEFQHRADAREECG